MFSSQIPRPRSSRTGVPKGGSPRTGGGVGIQLIDHCTTIAPAAGWNGDSKKRNRMKKKTPQGEELG